MKSLGRLEGVLADPVYTGKALACLTARAAQGFFAPSDGVVFLHTGGWPGSFAYASDLIAAA